MNYDDVHMWERAVYRAEQITRVNTLREAAREIHREAAYQLEMKLRYGNEPWRSPVTDPIDRLVMLEAILAERADMLSTYAQGTGS